MRGTKIWLLGGLTALVLSGCGLLPGTERTETEEVHVGDTVSTSWFDYTITSAQSADSYQDPPPGSTIPSPARSPRTLIRTAPPTRAAS